MKRHQLTFDYDREKVTTGILHIGVGNFHRAHQAFYTHMLLQNSNQMQWGICGLSLLQSDEPVVKALKKQNNTYSLTICGRNGKDETHQVGSIVDMIWAIKDPKRAIEKFADKNIKIITCTITEGGYNLSRSSGNFIFEDKNVQHDLAYPATPITVFGYVAEGLRLRMKKGAGPVTFLTCDNLQHNGDITKKVFLSFISAQDKK